ncbi:hypothetical protein DKT69_16575 [Micromonospora sicca]|uniref:Uncharacterized protein n=1 Tax=Micromonospora sicca TaxID=2202420 RepID=A0A317DJJ0_9ACTN|nr:hypothetical protein DKT69_16575 [Micromonospora sp. 4G51]
MEATAEEPGDADSRVDQRTESRAGKVRTRRNAKVRIGFTIACDLRARDRIEQAATVVGDDHEEVAAAGRLSREADTQQPAHRYVIVRRGQFEPTAMVRA